MNEYKIVRLTDKPELKEDLACWFNKRWGIPLEAYLESMDACLMQKSPVPQWYCVMDGDAIIAGLGVIENDFHNRQDLTPNVCAVYVNKDYRCRGIAADMLSFACNDMKKQGIDTMYLVTSHVGLYERYGWEFFCEVQCDGENKMSRMYVHNA